MLFGVVFVFATQQSGAFAQVTPPGGVIAPRALCTLDNATSTQSKKIDADGKYVVPQGWTLEKIEFGASQGLLLEKIKATIDEPNGKWSATLDVPQGGQWTAQAQMEITDGMGNSVSVKSNIKGVNVMP